MKEQIRGALEKFPINVIKDTLALLMCAETKNLNIAVPENRDFDSEEITDFVSLLVYAKRKYQFPELKSFQIEEGKVYFCAGNKRLLVAIGETGQEGNGKKEQKPKSGESGRFGQLELEE